MEKKSVLPFAIMVKRGIFSVKLMNAETNLPFPEHKRGPVDDDDDDDDDQRYHYYAELEPDSEYWIRVQVDLPEDEVYMCDFEIDGKDLGYFIYIDTTTFLDCGVRNRVGPNDIDQAIKVKAIFGNNAISSDSELWMGKVTVRFWMATFWKMDEIRDFQCPWQGGVVPNSFSSGEKALISTTGVTTRKTSASTGLYERYHRSQLLETISIGYCTALGLIHVGVLPKPEGWEQYQSMRRCGASPVVDSSNNIETEMQPQPMMMQVFSPTGEVVKTYDFYDLTHITNDGKV